MKHPSYNADFFRRHQERARNSAQIVVPLILELVDARSVVDVGCGMGSWLSIFRKEGVEDIFGVDGAYIDKAMLEVPPGQFLSFDLKRPLPLPRKFDLVVSLEVAEHLPPSCAETFINSLTELGPVVLFSAAIPFQGGTDHVNEQWPEYWIGHFQKRGYVAVDCLRKRIWHNEGVAWWYAQNSFLFIHQGHLERQPALQRERERCLGYPVSLVHPQAYLSRIKSNLRHVEFLERQHRATKVLGSLVPGEAAFILADENQFGNEPVIGRRAIPFLEKDGVYFGPPANDTVAIGELERLRSAGARFIAFAWPAFWWLDYYEGLHRHLRLGSNCVLQSDDLIVFDLSAPPGAIDAEKRPSNGQSR